MATVVLSPSSQLCSECGGYFIHRGVRWIGDLGRFSCPTLFVPAPCRLNAGECICSVFYEVMCITEYLREGGWGGEPEGQLLERPLNKKLIAVIISMCSDVGAFLDT